MLLFMGQQEDFLAFETMISFVYWLGKYANIILKDLGQKCF